MLPGRIQIYSENIEISRGLAAFAVLLFHAWIWFFNHGALLLFSPNSLSDVLSQGVASVGNLTFGFGFLGVNLFFVVSGFCIHVSQAAKSNPPLDVRRFLIKRFLRLYPLYAAVVLFLFWYWGPVRGLYDKQGVNFENLVGHLLFWHYAGPPAHGGMGISTVMWTIAIEVHFYLIYALTYPLLVRIGIGRIAIAMIILEVLYRIYDPVIAGRPGYLGPSRFALMRFGEWLLGAWLAELYVAGQIKRFRWPAAMLGCAVLLAGIVVGQYAGWTKYDATDVPAAICFFFLLGWLLNREQRARAHGKVIRGIRACGVWLGQRCYSLYLTHATVLMISQSYIRKLFHATGVTQALLQVAATLIVADIIYRLIEAPSHRMARRFGRQSASQQMLPMETRT